MKQFADPSLRKYTYVPTSYFGLILDHHASNDEEVNVVVGLTPSVGLSSTQLADDIRRDNRQKVMWGWVERTSKFLEHLSFSL